MILSLPLYHYHFQGSGSQLSGQRNSSELGSGLLSRWLSSHYHGGVHDEKSVAHHTVNLLTSTIKVDADQSDLRFCFRIISPTKNYTLQVALLSLALILVNYLCISCTKSSYLAMLSVKVGVIFNVCICVSVQAESALDQLDWIEKITGVIASLLSSQTPERVIPNTIITTGL